MRINLKILLIWAFLCINITAPASAGLTERINAVINQPSQKKVRYSVSIVNAATGKTVYTHNARTAMIPASNMKVITTAAALKHLGPDYTYTTKVGLAGDTLVILGSGDPLLGDPVTDKKYNRPTGWIFNDIAAKLKQGGIESINDIVVDSTVFDDQRVHPNWPAEQLNRWYACEVSGLNYNGNCIYVTTENNRGKINIRLDPRTAFVTVTNKVKAINSGKSAVGSYRKTKPNEIIVFGKCKKRDGPFDVAIERPAAFFGFLLAEHLAAAGISTKGQLVEKAFPADGNFKLIAQYSTPITECLSRCNKDSFGLAAEALLKTIAAHNNPTGKDRGWSAGCAAISNYLGSLGIDKSEFNIDDGSGLSRKNKLSANTLTTVLLDVYKSRNRQLYKDSLAQGGEDGTVSRYFNEKKYRGRVFGKTGYIAGVRSFSGLCTTESGDFLFAIITNNNWQSRKTINDITKAVIDSN